MQASDGAESIETFLSVADNFEIVQWLRPKGGPRSVVEQYHRLRDIPVRPVDTGLRLGDFLLGQEDPEIVAFGADQHT